MTTPLSQIIASAIQNFTEIKIDDWSIKPSPTKWSKKETLGHLCDSAFNNMRRFIVTQYQENDKIYYLQDDWVRIQDYQNTDVKDIITLWKLLNYQIANIIECIPDSLLQNTCDTSKDEKEFYTLEFLMTDYVDHMNHHLSQILAK